MNVSFCTCCIVLYSSFTLPVLYSTSKCLNYPTPDQQNTIINNTIINSISNFCFLASVLKQLTRFCGTACKTGPRIEQLKLPVYGEPEMVQAQHSPLATFSLLLRLACTCLVSYYTMSFPGLTGVCKRSLWFLNPFWIILFIYKYACVCVCLGVYCICLLYCYFKVHITQIVNFNLFLLLYLCSLSKPLSIF